MSGTRVHARQLRLDSVHATVSWSSQPLDSSAKQLGIGLDCTWYHVAQHRGQHSTIQRRSRAGSQRLNTGCTIPVLSLHPAALMRGVDNVLTAKTSEKLEDIIPRLNTVSGLPVVDANNRVIGVISRKVRSQHATATTTCSRHHKAAACMAGLYLASCVPACLEEV